MPFVSTVSVETIVVGALADARLGDGEVRAAHRVVDRVDADEIDRQAAVDGVLIGFDVAAALVHVQLDVDVAVVLEREEMVVAVDDRDAGIGLDVAGGDRARLALRDAQDRVFHVLRRARASAS